MGGKHIALATVLLCLTPADPEDNAQPPGATRSQYLKVDHYVQVGNLPDGTPIFEPVYADFFDNNANNTTTTADPGRLEPPIGDENNLIFALGGNDTVVTGAGDEGGSGTIRWQERQAMIG